MFGLWSLSCPYQPAPVRLRCGCRSTYNLCRRRCCPGSVAQTIRASVAAPPAHICSCFPLRAMTARVLRIVRTAPRAYRSRLVTPFRNEGRQAANSNRMSLGRISLRVDDGDSGCGDMRVAIQRRRRRRPGWVEATATSTPLAGIACSILSGNRIGYCCGATSRRFELFRCLVGQHGAGRGTR